MLSSTTHTRADASVVRLSGVLNASTYQQVRDSVIKVAVEESTAVIVDINDLEVRDEQSWAVFTSARWLVQQWPEVPIALVSSDPGVRKRLAERSVARYVPSTRRWPPRATPSAAGSAAAAIAHTNISARTHPA
jgi:anti-anti-sigma regulatory factor